MRFRGLVADNDATFNSKANNPTTIEYFKKAFKKYKHLFGKTTIYYNIKAKDIGREKENISLIKTVIE
jgi:hypothetical protein